MKKLFYIFIVGVLLLGCSQQDDFMKQLKMGEPDFPSHIQEFGKKLQQTLN